MVHFPEELWIHVLSYFRQSPGSTTIGYRETAEVIPICTVSRLFNRLATPTLFQRLDFQHMQPAKIASCLELLFSRPDLARMVQDVRVNAWILNEVVVGGMPGDKEIATAIGVSPEYWKGRRNQHHDSECRPDPSEYLAMALLLSCPNLQYWSVKHCPSRSNRLLTEALSLRRAIKPTQLRAVSLLGVELQPQDIEYISQLPLLEHVRVRGLNFDHGLDSNPEPSELTGIKVLRLDDTHIVTGRFERIIAMCPKLEALEFSWSHNSPRACELDCSQAQRGLDIARHTLRRLKFHGKEVQYANDRTMTSFREFEKLQSLTVFFRMLRNYRNPSQASLPDILPFSLHVLEIIYNEDPAWLLAGLLELIQDPRFISLHTVKIYTYATVTLGLAGTNWSLSHTSGGGVAADKGSARGGNKMAAYVLQQKKHELRR